MTSSLEGAIKGTKEGILFDLDTIRIEQTSISDPEGSYKILKVLKKVKDIVEYNFENLEQEQL